MNEYEEFGLTPSASREEIQKAHRTLARLLHPDNFQDEELKRLADCQMKRVNATYARLTDPNRSRQETNHTSHRPSGVRRWLADLGDWWEENGSWRLLRRNSVWLATTLACVFGIYRLLSVLGGPGSIFPAASTQPVIAEAKAPAAPQSTAAPGPSDSDILRELRRENRDLQRRLDSVVAKINQERSEPPPEPRIPAPAHITPAQPAAILPVPINPPEPAPVKPPPTTAALPETKPERAAGTMEGTWVYTPSPRDRSPNDLYPAEYIELVIGQDGDAITGRYRGRYTVADRPISPEVQFRFGGKTAAGSYHWTGNGGAEGEVKLRLIAENALAVEWFTSRFGRQATLSSGTAVLVRRRD